MAIPCLCPAIFGALALPIFTILVRTAGSVAVIGLHIGIGTASFLYSCPFCSSVPCSLYSPPIARTTTFRKYILISEVSNGLEALAVQVDKVPTLVDKIVSDSTKDLSQLNQLSSELSETKEELVLKLAA